MESRLKSYIRPFESSGEFTVSELKPQRLKDYSESGRSSFVSPDFEDPKPRLYTPKRTPSVRKVRGKRKRVGFDNSTREVSFPCLPKPGTIIKTSQYTLNTDTSSTPRDTKIQTLRSSTGSSNKFIIPKVSESLYSPKPLFQIQRSSLEIAPSRPMTQRKLKLEDLEKTDEHLFRSSQKKLDTSFSEKQLPETSISDSSDKKKLNPQLGSIPSIEYDDSFSETNSNEPGIKLSPVPELLRLSEEELSQESQVIANYRTPQEITKAAVLIQAWVRGHQIRSSIKLHKTPNKVLCRVGRKVGDKYCLISIIQLDHEVRIRVNEVGGPQVWESKLKKPLNLSYKNICKRLVIRNDQLRVAKPPKHSQPKWNMIARVMKKLTNKGYLLQFFVDEGCHKLLIKAREIDSDQEFTKVCEICFKVKNTEDLKKYISLIIIPNLSIQEGNIQLLQEQPKDSENKKLLLETTSDIQEKNFSISMFENQEGILVEARQNSKLFTLQLRLKLPDSPSRQTIDKICQDILSRLKVITKNGKEALAIGSKREIVYKKGNYIQNTYFIVCAYRKKDLVEVNAYNPVSGENFSVNLSKHAINIKHAEQEIAKIIPKLTLQKDSKQLVLKT